jgi:hypothetical protein
MTPMAISNSALRKKCLLTLATVSAVRAGAPSGPDDIDKEGKTKR